MPLERPADDVGITVIEALEWQRDYCGSAGSPMAAALLSALVDDLTGPRTVADLIADQWRFGDLPGLRLMSVVHRLALERRAPLVALHCPTLGGSIPSGDEALRVWQAAVVQCVLDHPDEVQHGLSQVPQTNETGRARLLRGAMSRLGPQPVRLVELCASAGLNLRADHLPGDVALEVGPLPPVIERIGCDLAPIDPATPEGRTLLSSYVWIDDAERFARLAHALDVAADIPVNLVQADAADFAESLTLTPGATTVIWHSAMWVYLDATTRSRILAAIAALASQATPVAPLAHVSWEWRPTGTADGEPFALIMRRWGAPEADGRPRVIARGHSHGPGAHPVDELLDREPLADV